MRNEAAQVVRSEAGSSPWFTVSGLPLVVGSWLIRCAFGVRRLAFGVWRLAFGGLVLVVLVLENREGARPRAPSPCCLAIGHFKNPWSEPTDRGVAIPPLRPEGRVNS